MAAPSSLDLRDTPGSYDSALLGVFRPFINIASSFDSLLLDSEDLQVKNGTRLSQRPVLYYSVGWDSRRFS
jgi:hypothetical protein